MRMKSIMKEAKGFCACIAFFFPSANGTPMRFGLHSIANKLKGSSGVFALRFDALTPPEHPGLLFAICFVIFLKHCYASFLHSLTRCSSFSSTQLPVYRKLQDARIIIVFVVIIFFQSGAGVHRIKERNSAVGEAGPPSRM